MPILIDESRSAFSIADLPSGRKSSERPRSTSKIWGDISRRLPTLGTSLRSADHIRRLKELITCDNTPPALVLVVGGGYLGGGVSQLVADPRVTVVNGDIALTQQTGVVCDAHDLPFATGSIGAVVIQNVLYAVADPQRCVAEIHRVLKDGGCVYAETPFMQPVNSAPYDFTRFSQLGHRRLFRAFDEIDSGISCGPAMALAWQYEALLMSFASSKLTAAATKTMARLTGFWLKYLDRYLIDKDAAARGAAAFYFLGRRRAAALTDQELLAAWSARRNGATEHAEGPPH